MRNLWVNTDVDRAMWTAKFDGGGAESDPRRMLDFIAYVIQLGDETEVWRLLEVPALGYSRAKKMDLMALIEQRYAREGVVDFFAFNDCACAPWTATSSTAEAKMAWYDADDRIIEADCVDLGAILREQEPVPDSIPTGFMLAYPAVRVVGRELRYVGQPPRLQDHSPYFTGAYASFALRSDIWFPWIFGGAHPYARLHDPRRFDNRELANRHTPRLNRFISSIAAKVRELGGSWTIDPGCTMKGWERWLDENGIFLDPEPPPKWPDSAFDAEWF